jgi:hypothetical protein
MALETIYAKFPQQFDAANSHTPLCAPDDQFLKESGQSPSRGRLVRCRVQLLPRSQIVERQNASAMAARLTDHVWTVAELLSATI